MKDIEFLGIEFDNAEGFKVLDTEENTVTYTEGGGGSPTLETVTKTYTPSASQQTETITPSSGYDGIGEVDVTVEAISPTYVGTGIARKSSSDLTLSMNTVTAPAGYYESAASCTMARAVISEIGADVEPDTSTHTAAIVPYFDISSNGYIPIDEYTGTPLSVSASELVSGTKSITSNGTGIDVANYASVDVAVPSSVNLVKYALRPDAVLSNSYTYDKYMNADESITIPGYSTSAQTIKASASLGSITLDRDNYYYYIVERMLTIPTYSVTSVAKGRCEYHIGAHVYEIIDIPGSSMHSLINPSLYYTSRLNTVTTVLASYRELYYSSGTALATYSTQAYGVCQAAVAPSISSGTVTINSPTVTCRGHTTYFTSTYANALTDVRAQYVIEVYKAPKNSNYGYDAWSNDQLMKQLISCVNSNTQKLT